MQRLENLTEQFRTLAALGQRLIDCHLLKDVSIPPRHRFEDEGDGVVGRVRYMDERVRIVRIGYQHQDRTEIYEIIKMH